MRLKLAAPRACDAPGPHREQRERRGELADRGRALLYVVRRLVTLHQGRADAEAAPRSTE